MEVTLNIWVMGKKGFMLEGSRVRQVRVTKAKISLSLVKSTNISFIL